MWQLDSAQRRRLRRKLLRWYDSARRDLPWRQHADNAYHQLLAELMLQQTQVTTVVPYFERFVSTYPTVEDLARAELDEVLKLWAGLGYYARARYLHQAARQIVDVHGGTLPDNVDELRKLPGIGRSTAGSIASISFGRREPVLDGNIKRVLARLCLIDADVKDPRTIRLLWTLAERLLPQRRCGDFNQALMELGATLCKPTKPVCCDCPLGSDCAALLEKRVAQIPVIRKRKKPTAVTAVVAAIRNEDRYLFRRRVSRGLWGGLWELPVAFMNDQQSARRRALALAAELGGTKRHNIEMVARPLGPIRHQLTHRTLSLYVYHCRYRRACSLPDNSDNLRWVALNELDQLALPRVQSKIIDRLPGE